MYGYLNLGSPNENNGIIMDNPIINNNAVESLSDFIAENLFITTKRNMITIKK